VVFLEEVRLIGLSLSYICKVSSIYLKNDSAFSPRMRSKLSVLTDVLFNKFLNWPRLLGVLSPFYISYFSAVYVGWVYVFMFNGVVGSVGLLFSLSFQFTIITIYCSLCLILPVLATFYFAAWDVTHIFGFLKLPLFLFVRCGDFAKRVATTTNHLGILNSHLEQK